MRKKTISLVAILVLVFTFSITTVKAQDAILGETLVYKYTHIEDLPVQFVKGSEIKTYEYEDEIIPDFRHYFQVYDNAQTILNMHSISGEVDLGGYTWDMDFDIDTIGVYEISLSYSGVTGFKSETIELEVIEEDTEGPEVFILSGNFNKTRIENPAEFLSEFNNYLRKSRVYDKVDGVIQITIDDFNEEDIETLKTADLREAVLLTLNVEDSAGNITEETVTLNIVDLKAPNIHNATTVTTRKGQRINFTSHLSFSDNYSAPSEIIKNYEVYSTLVVKNIWEAGVRRANPSEGTEIKNHLRLTTDGIDGFAEYLEVNYPTVYVVGDYYEISSLEEETSYVYISKKETIEDSELPINVWEITTDKTKATGRRLERFETFNMSQQELLDYAKSEHEEGFRVNDYYQVLDLTTENRYFVYIAETDNIYRDKHDQPIIDFDEVGVYYVRVEATDEYGNIASAVYRVVVADGLSLMQGVLIANAVVLGIGIIGVGFFIIFRRRQ